MCVKIVHISKESFAKDEANKKHYFLLTNIKYANTLMWWKIINYGKFSLLFLLLLLPSRGSEKKFMLPFFLFFVFILSKIKSFQCLQQVWIFFLLLPIFFHLHFRLSNQDKKETQHCTRSNSSESFKRVVRICKINILRSLQVYMGFGINRKSNKIQSWDVEVI